MFHVSQSPGNDGALHLTLEGELDQVHLVALQGLVEEGMKKGVNRYVLHCRGLRRADDEGLRFLLKLNIAGAQLVELPWHIGWRLSLMLPQTSHKS